MKKFEQFIEVPVAFVEEALEARYETVKDLWAGAAALALWPLFLEFCLDCGVTDSPSVIVDNYLINGDFISREDVESEEGEWEDVTDNALVYNEDYALMSC